MKLLRYILTLIRGSTPYREIHDDSLRAGKEMSRAPFLPTTPWTLHL